MKKSDLKRLKKAAELYKEIEHLLDTTYDSMEKDNVEYIEFHDIAKTRISTVKLVSDMVQDTKNSRRWIQSKIVMIEEQL